MQAARRAKRERFRNTQAFGLRAGLRGKRFAVKVVIDVTETIPEAHESGNMMRNRAYNAFTGRKMVNLIIYELERQMPGCEFTIIMLPTS
jgi:hypothetical protein